MNYYMKYYPKTFADVSKKPNSKFDENIGSSIGTTDELADTFRDFYKKAHIDLFDMLVKQVWLENKFLFKGERRPKRGLNGQGADRVYGFFMKFKVGITQKSLTQGFIFSTVPTYFKDFFPYFLENNPFKNPELYKFPYKNIGLDQLSFVYQFHDRLELLKKADEDNMNAGNFVNWAANHVLSYNDEPDAKYSYSIRRHGFLPYIKKEM